jgi:antirestriction protein ArdC
MANRTTKGRKATKGDKRQGVRAAPSSADAGYAEITARIVAAIEAGAGSYKLPWQRENGTDRPVNALSGNRYNGINVLSLWEAGDRCGYKSGTWATFNQWKELGCPVRKGERGTRIVFVKPAPVGEPPEDGEVMLSKGRTVVRFHCVFNAEQVEGYEEPTAPEAVKTLDGVEEFVRLTGAEIRHGGGRAFYRRDEDYIQMPAASSFAGTPTRCPTESYYAVLLHELAH